MTTKKFYLIDTLGIFDPFAYSVDSLPDKDRKRAYEDIIAAAGLTHHHEQEFRTIRGRGSLPLLGSCLNDRDVDFARQVASLNYAANNLEQLRKIGVKGVHFDGYLPEDQDFAAKSRQILRDRLLEAALYASHYILDWEYATMFLIVFFGNDPNKAVSYLRSSAKSLRSQYDAIVKAEKCIPDGVGRLKWDHILGQTDAKIAQWVIDTFNWENYPDTAKKRLRWQTLVNESQLTGDNVEFALHPYQTLDEALDAIVPVLLPRSHKKKPVITTQPKPDPVIQPKLDPVIQDPKAELLEAVAELEKYYLDRLSAEGITLSKVIYAGAVCMTSKGRFRYSLERDDANPSFLGTVFLESINQEQAKEFQNHLVAFDEKFQRYIEENSHAKAQTILAQGIKAFLASKKIA